MENSFTNRDIWQIESIIRYCNDIEDAIQTYGADEEDFLSNVHFQNSCAFSMMQIGEMVKRLSHELRTKYDEIEWSGITKFRDILSHNYNNVHLHTFWETTMNETAPLKEQCENILKELKDNP